MTISNPNYAWLNSEPAPKMLIEAVKLYGVMETSDVKGKGPKSNPIIIEWAKELGFDGAYSSDAIPWCGLFMSICAKRAGWEIPSTIAGFGPLWADTWVRWYDVGLPSPMLGDVLPLGGHVTMYVGEDTTHYHCLGGNQHDMVNITRFPKTRLLQGHSRRAHWKISQPPNVRIVNLNTDGTRRDSLR